MSEGEIRRVLRRLAKQRVAQILQPGNVAVVELAVKYDQNTAPALMTCHMRGWVEVMEESVPTARLNPDGSLPPGWQDTAPIYRLTEAGWNVVHGTHARSIAIFWVAFATLVASIVAVLLAIPGGAWGN